MGIHIVGGMVVLEVEYLTLSGSLDVRESLTRLRVPSLWNNSRFQSSELLEEKLVYRS